MPELEVTPEHAADPNTRRVGILVGVVGILLSVVTIASHRAHTDAVIHRTEANDQWSYYQAKKIRENTEEVAISLVTSLGTDAAKIESMTQSSRSARAKYAADAEKIQDDARAKDKETEKEEHRALFFDIGEGLLELGLVLVLLVFFGAQSVLSRLWGARKHSSGSDFGSSWVSCFEDLCWRSPSCSAALAVSGPCSPQRPRNRLRRRVEARSQDLLAVGVVHDDKMTIHLAV